MSQQGKERLRYKPEVLSNVIRLTHDEFADYLSDKDKDISKLDQRQQSLIVELRKKVTIKEKTDLRRKRRFVQNEDDLTQETPEDKKKRFDEYVENVMKESGLNGKLLESLAMVVEIKDRLGLTDYQFGLLAALFSMRLSLTKGSPYFNSPNIGPINKDLQKSKSFYFEQEGRRKSAEKNNTYFGDNTEERNKNFLLEYLRISAASIKDHEEAIVEEINGLNVEAKKVIQRSIDYYSALNLS